MKKLTLIMMLTLLSSLLLTARESNTEMEAEPVMKAAAEKAPATEEESPLTFYMNGDVDADMAFGMGSSFTGVGHALDANFTFGTSYRDIVSGEFYLTVSTGDAGDLPAFGLPGNKWAADMAFDGVCISVNDLFGFLNLNIMDYTYDTGSTSYYLFKNQNMILPLYYPRGIKAAFNLGKKASLEVGIGVDDGAAADIYVADSQFKLMNDKETDLLNVYFAMGKENAAEDFTFIATGFDFTLGDYLQVFGGALLPINSNQQVALHGGLEGSIGGDFSLAYAILGGSDRAERLILGSTFLESFMIYTEPGYSFNDYFAAGLPLEYHHYRSQLAGTQS
ncbi:MAG TPA: hypothetical protein VKS21_04220, partial [Spirochaetota bacterium]|nr:hypothetical protein [Spirochaetota bacterium]